jgi:hypothetical protein
MLDGRFSSSTLSGSFLGSMMNVGTRPRIMRPTMGYDIRVPLSSIRLVTSLSSCTCSVSLVFDPS